MKDNNELLKIDGVSDIISEFGNLKSERDYYKESLETLLGFIISNTRLNWNNDGLRIDSDDEFNYMLKFLAPVEYYERLKILKDQKARKEKAEAKAKEEVENE